MKICTKKSILQKTILVILTVLCVNFIVPTYSNAGVGGVLMQPIIDLTAALGDIFQSLMQWCMTGQVAKGESLLDSNIMVDQGDSRIKEGSGTPNISVSVDQLDLGWFTNGENYQVPIIKYTPEEIFSNKVPYLDINFINPKLTKTNTEYMVDGIAVSLQPTISSWYIALRNLSIVGLLCVLVYVGIKIVLSSTAQDKAKYKQMFTDWLIALCILFFLHYIMSFVLVMVDSVNEAIGGSGYTANSMVISVDGEKYQTNMMGAARFMVQSKDTVQRFSYCIIYIALVAYTAVFTWHYLKRVLMMAFLTIIAPLVALTYPIDKMGDGKAQAFSMWLKEYVYNAIIQPFHLIIYMIFVGSAMDLAKNFIYTIAAIAFILPAEKFLKHMFGFDKAPLGTMGALTGFTAGSIASKLAKGGKSSSAPKGGTAGASNESKPPRFEKKHGTEGISYAENRQLGMGQAQVDTPKLQDNTSKVNMDNINDRARQELSAGNLSDAERQEFEELGNKLDNADYNDMYLNPDQYAQEQARYEELQRRQEAKNQQEQLEEQAKMMQIREKEMEEALKESQENKEENKRNKPGFKQGMRNIVSAHGGTKQIALKGAKNIGKAVKFTARTGLTAAGAMAGIGMGIASGQGLAGIVAGATAGKAMGRTLGRKVTELPENAIGAVRTYGGGALERRRRTIDTFNGNTELQDKATAKAFMKDNTTEQYIRDKWTQEHDGMAPSAQEFKDEKAKIKEYADEGMTDIAAIYRARKAEKFGVSSQQSAKIALLAKDRGITSKELGDEKEFNRRRQDFTQEFIGKGQSEEVAARNADYVLNVMKAQVGQAHNLQKVETVPQESTKGSTKTKSSTNSKTREKQERPQKVNIGETTQTRKLRTSSTNTAPRTVQANFNSTRSVKPDTGRGKK